MSNFISTFDRFAEAANKLMTSLDCLGTGQPSGRADASQLADVRRCLLTVYWTVVEIPLPRELQCGQYPPKKSSFERSERFSQSLQDFDAYHSVYDVVNDDESVEGRLSVDFDEIYGALEFALRWRDDGGELRDV